MKKYQTVLGLGVSALTLSMAAGQAAFTPGNLVVLQAGEDGGVAALTSAATKVFIREIDVNDGHIVQTIPVPFTFSASGNRALTQSGSATSEGFLHRSTDGKRLVFVGYNVDAGTASVVTTASATNARVVGVVDCAGNLDTTTALGDAYSGGNIRAAASTNGTDIWVSGNGSGTAPGPVQSGVRYATLGGTTTVALQDNGGGTLVTPLNTRVVNIFFGQLYTTSSSGTFQGVCTVGSGLPTTIGQLPALLNGFPTAANLESAYDFFYSDADTLYVADDSAAAQHPGVQKWTQSGGTWTWQYSLTAGLPSTSVRCMTGKAKGGSATLYVTTAGGPNGANSIMSVTDTGAASTFGPALATSAAFSWWRGIAFAPTGCGGPVACYANCDGSTSNPLLTANDFQCFLNQYATGQSYANCDQSTNPPVLTANDFQCFLNAYAVGCT